MNEIYFRKNAILDIYKPLNDQLKDETRKLNSQLTEFKELERRQNAFLNDFPNLQNFGNFQTHFDFSIDHVENQNPYRIHNIDYEPTYNKFRSLQE